MIAPTSHTDLPPFPDGLPLAPIAKISHAKLLRHDKEEAARVLEACRTHGFFYLDLTDSESGEEILKQSKSHFSFRSRSVHQRNGIPKSAKRIKARMLNAVIGRGPRKPGKHISVPKLCPLGFLP
jgi:hypothetical protein